MAICEKASWSRPVGRSSHGLQRKEGWDIHTRCGRSTNTKLLALSTQQSTVAIPIRHSLHVQFLQRPVISPHLQSAIPVSKPLLFFPESKPWQFSETLHQHQSKDRNMRRKSISRASLSSEGRANKDSENPSQDANRLGDKTDNQLIGGSPEFASDSTSMSNFQLPKIAMVDEGSIGSSRFDVAVRALKGDFDPPTPSENTEKGTLLEALVQFPSFYTFSVVGKVETTSRKPGHDFTKDSLETVERMCGTRLAEDSYSVKERAGGKFLSLRITTLVESADLVKATYTELRKDPRVIMAY